MRQEELRVIERDLLRIADEYDLRGDDAFDINDVRNLARRIGAEVVRLELAEAH